MGVRDFAEKRKKQSAVGVRAFAEMRKNGSETATAENVVAPISSETISDVKKLSERSSSIRNRENQVEQRSATVLPNSNAGIARDYLKNKGSGKTGTLPFVNESQKNHIEKMSFDVEAAQKELDNLMTPNEEVIALEKKVSSGNATDADRTRLTALYDLFEEDPAYAERAAKEVDSRRSALRREIKENGDYQKLIGYYNLSSNPDFAEKSVRSNAESASSASVYGDWSGRVNDLDAKSKATYDEILEKYGEEEANSYLYTLFGTPTDEYKQDYLGYLTDDERKIFNYVLNTEGEDKAREFLGFMQGNLNARAAYHDYQNAVHDGFKGGFSDYLNAFVYGIGSAVSGVKNAFSNESSDPSYAEIKSSLTREGRIERADSKFGKWAAGAAYDTLNSGGNMLPSIAIGAINPIAGKVAFGLSAGGNAKQEALRDGYTASQATAYGILNGAAEVLLQDAVGGIAELGGKGLSNALSKIPGAKNAATKIENAISRISVGKQAAARTAIKVIDNLSGEFSDEYMQEILDPVFRNICLGENNTFKPFTEEALYSGIIGALMAVGSTSTNAVLNYGNVLQISENAFDAQGLRDTMSDFIENTSDIQREDVVKARELISEKIENREEIDIGDIAEYTSTLTENEIANGFGISESSVRDEADIRAQLGNAENANAVASALYRMQNGEFTESDAETVKASPEARKLFSEYFDTDITESTPSGEIADAVRNFSDDSFREISYDAQNLLKSIRANNGHTQEVDTAFYKAYFEGYNGAERTWDSDSAISDAASQTAYELGADAKASIGTFKVVGGASLSSDVASVFSKIAKDMGVSITYGGKGSVANGSVRRGYFNSHSEIRIYEDAKVKQVGGKALYKGEAAARIILGHELTHVLQKRSPEQYRNFADLAVKASGGENEIAKYMRIYTLSRQNAIDEIAADFAMQYLFSDEKTARNITKHHSKLAQAILDAIAWIRDKLGIKTSDTETLMRMYGKMYNEGMRNAQNGVANIVDEGVRYSTAYLQAEANSDIIDLIDKVKSNRFKDNEYVYLGNVTRDLANRIEEITKVNVYGYRIIIEARMIRHILEYHGENGRTDNSMRDDIDIAKMQYALSSPDDMSYGGKTKAYSYMRNGYNRTSPTVLYEKEIGDNSYYVVQAIPQTKAKTLYIVSAFIGQKGYKNRADQPANISETGNPDVTSEIAADQTPLQIISETSKKVKEIFGFTVYEDAKVNEDLLEELRIHDPNAKVDRHGNVTVYHRTTAESAAEIRRTGIMRAKEDALFFSSKDNGYASDYGDTVVEFSIPSTDLLVNDIFDGEVHFEIPLKYKNGGFSLDVSKYLAKEADSNESAFSNGEVKNSIAGSEKILEEGTNRVELDDTLREKVKELEKQLKSANKKAAYWEGQTKRTALKTVREEDVKALARNLVSSHGSEASIEEISDRLSKLGEYIVNGGNNGNLDWDDLKDMAVPIASDIIDSAYVLANEEEMQTFKDIKGYFKGNTLSISDIDSQDIANFDKFRKHNFGRFKLSKTSGIPVDVAYQELTEQFGEGYFPNSITHPADQIQRIAEVFDDIQPVYEGAFSGYEAEAKEYCAFEIINSMLDETVRQNPATFADRAAARLASEKAAGKQRLSALRDEKNARIAELIHDGNERTKAAVKKEKQLRDKKIRELKTKYRDSRKKASESRSASAMREKIMRHAKELSAKLLKPTDKKHIPDRLKGTVASLLEAINLESNYTVGEDGKHHKDDLGTPTKRTEAFRAVKDEIAKLSGELVIDPDLFGSEDGVEGLFDRVLAMSDIRIADMNLEQLSDVWQTIRAIEAAVRTADKMLSESRFAAVSAAADALRTDNAGKKARLVFRFNGFNKAQDLVLLDMLTPETYCHMLGDAGDTLFRMMRDAQDKHISILDEIRAFTNDAIGKTNVRAIETETHIVMLGGEKVKLTTAQIMELYVMMRRDAAKRHILSGGILPEVQKNAVAQRPQTNAIIHISENEITAAISLLTSEQKALAEKLQDYLSNELSDYGNAASMAVYGYRKFVEDFYWRIRVDKKTVKTDVSKDTAVTTVANRGFTKSVNPNANNPVVLGNIFDTFANSAVEMATYAAWLGTSEDLNRIRNYVFRDGSGTAIGTVQGILDTVHGQGGAKYMQQLLTDIAVGVKSTDNSFTSGLTSSVKAASVGANLSVIAQQPCAAVRALNMIDSKYLIAGMKPSTGWKKAQQYAPIAKWKSWGYFDVHTGRQIKDVFFNTDSALNKVRETAMKGAEIADNMTWGTLWNACEAELKDKNKTLLPGSEEFYSKVANRFTEIIDRTQVVDGILQRSQIMRKGGEFTKQVTAFMAEPTKTYNMMVSALYDARTKNSASAKKKLAQTVFVLLLNALVTAAAKSFITAMRDDDREKKYFEKWLDAFKDNAQDNLNPFNYIVYIKDIASIMQGYDVSRMDMDAVETVASAGKSVVNLAKGESKYTPISVFTTLLGSAARFFGLPFDNVKRDVTGIISTYATETGNYLMQYHMDKSSYGISYPANRSRYYDLAFSALRGGDIDAYEIIRRGLLEAQSADDGIDIDDFNAAMRSRYEKAVATDSSFSLGAASERLIGYREKYDVADDEEHSFSVSDLSVDAAEQYSDSLAEIYGGVLDNLSKYEEYDNLDIAVKSKAESAAYRLANEMALEDASDGTYKVDTKWMLWATGGEDAGVDESEAILFKSIYDTTSGDDKKDAVINAAKKAMPWLTAKEIAYLKSNYWKN